MHDIKFSILVPVFNTEKYIKDCIESVLNQKYQNFELILIDDGSTDNSGQICDEYASKNDKIIVIHNENQGLVLTRREAIRKSTGDFLMFLDSDDCYRKDALELVYKTISEYNCDLVFFNVSNNENYSTKDRDYGFVHNQVFEGKTKQVLYEEIITTDNLNNLCFKAVKRSIVDIEHDYKEFASITSSEDLLQSLPIIDKCKKAVYVNESLYFYRQHSSSMVHNFSYKSFCSIKTVCYELALYIKKWGREDLISSFNSRIIKMVFSYGRVISFDKNMSREKKKFELLQLSKDEFFIHAFENYNKSSISRKDLFFIKFIYKRKIKAFLFYSWLRRAISKIIHFGR